MVFLWCAWAGTISDHDSCLHQLSVRPCHANDRQNQLLEGKCSCIPFVTFVFAYIGGPHGQRVSGLHCGPMLVHIVHFARHWADFLGHLDFPGNRARKEVVGWILRRNQFWAVLQLRAANPGDWIGGDKLYRQEDWFLRNLFFRCAATTHYILHEFLSHAGAGALKRFIGGSTVVLNEFGA